MKRKALLVMDTQVNMFDDSFAVFNGAHILKVIAEMIDKARRAQVEVIYIRNNGPAGEPDEPGTPGWHIHPAVSPLQSDLLIDKESANAFAGTNLQSELTSRKIEQLYIVGMQTEMCVATTVEEAVKKGFSVVLVEDGHTTFDWEDIAAVDAINHHNQWLTEFASIQKSQDIIF